MQEYISYTRSDPKDLHTADNPTYTVTVSGKEYYLLQRIEIKNEKQIGVLLFSPVVFQGALCVAELPEEMHVELIGSWPRLQRNRK